ncbi:MAG: hypothetical protein KDD19_24025 [Phaeodactylibacter sp.]|nr:hypothetical protein [Phaeodactylibacter sp.]MCB9048361.1 hypothetical protein [Lewinellaceae bacterium]
MIHTIRYISLAGLLLWTAALAGQRDDVPARARWGEELTEPAGTRITKAISANKDGAYMLRQKNEGALSNEQVYIEYYDSDMKLRRSQKMDLNYKGKRRDFEDVAMIGGQLYLFTSFNNQAKKKNYLFYQKVSSRLQASRDLEMIAEVEALNKAREGSFNLVISTDSSRVLLYSQLPYQKRDPERFALNVFDNQMNKLWSRDIILPYSDQQFAVEDYRVDREGNVYLLGVLYMDGVRERRRGRPNYQYVILAYTRQGEDVQEYQVALKDKFITDLAFRIADNGDLVCAGFFSERGTYSVKGTCFFRLNAATKEIFNLSFKEFGFEFRTEFMTPGELRRASRAEANDDANREPELFRFSLDELVLRSDGGAVLVAEQYYVFERAYRTWDGTLRFDYFYNYNDIIVVNIQPDGGIEWATRIPKRQETVNDGGYYSSYAMSIVRDRLYFIFNDNSRNFSNDGSNRLYNFNGRNSIVALAELRKDGQLFMYPLFHNRDAEVITRPKICKQVGSRRMMVYGERGRQYRFAELEFD